MLSQSGVTPVPWTASPTLHDLLGRCRSRRWWGRNDERASWLSAEERAVAKILPGDERTRRLRSRIRDNALACNARKLRNAERARRGLLPRSRRFRVSRNARAYDQHDTIDGRRRRRSRGRQSERETRNEQPYQTQPPAWTTAHREHRATASGRSTLLIFSALRSSRGWRPWTDPRGTTGGWSDSILARTLFLRGTRPHLPPRTLARPARIAFRSQRRRRRRPRPSRRPCSDLRRGR